MPDEALRHRGLSHGFADWFATVMRLDERPVVEPLAADHARRHAVAFIWDIIRTMLWKRAALVVLATVVAQTLASTQPYALGKLIDALNRSLSGQGGGDGIVFWTTVVFAFWIISPLLFQLAQLINVYLGPQLRVAIKYRLFQHLLRHAPAYFHDNLPGRLAQKVTQAANSGWGVMNIVMVEIIQTIVLIFASGILLGSLSPGYGIVIIVWIIVFLAATAYLGFYGITLGKNVQNAISKVSGRLVDTINNWDLVRSFARLDLERSALVDLLHGEARWSRRSRLFFVGMALFHLLLGASLMLWLVLSALADTRDGVMTVGDFTMVCMVGMAVVRMVRMLGRRMVDLFGEYGALRDGIELIMQPHALTDPPSGQALAVGKGGIAFRHVSFAYPDGTRVFDGLNLSIRAGEKVGLVGASGSGKTTLIRLLTRQFEPDTGSILIDGQDITTVTQDSLNRAIGEVGQVPNVFHRSVGDNIAYGTPDALVPEIWQAAEVAHCLDFIERRSGGMETLVGERGLKLSGGERQRLAIARAWLKNAPILVLDEATSSLDSKAEAIIQDALMRLMAGRTVIAIAHRLSTITGMDRLLVLDRGRLVEEGSHGELLAKGGAYAAFWREQVKTAHAG